MSTRDRLLNALRRRRGESGVPPTVDDLAADLELSATTIRRQLSKLIDSGLVIAIPDGRWRRYLVRDGAVAPEADETGKQRPPNQGPRRPQRSDTNPDPEDEFQPNQLERMVISMPLQQFLNEWAAAKTLPIARRRQAQRSIEERTRVFDGDRFSVIIDLNLDHAGGVPRARERVLDLLLLVDAADEPMPDGGSALARVTPAWLGSDGGHYLVAHLRPDQIKELVRLDQRPVPAAIDRAQMPPAEQLARLRADRARRAIFRIWPDNVVNRQGYDSLPTIKADAARNSFGCTGRGMVWALVDSGIDGRHPHFLKHRNLLDLPAGVEHLDFTRRAASVPAAPLVDRYGHGTHVAGIIAGALEASADPPPTAEIYERNADDASVPYEVTLGVVAGVAPECKLVSLKVLDDKGKCGVTEIIAALETVQRINSYGKDIVIQGVNLSLGYPYDPKWYACGHSPLCEVVNRLAQTGVCVVVAAGNTGYAFMDTVMAGTWAQGMAMSINDPGNAEGAITVGSTHRDSPHTYGVSFFSSKGPTGDGRSKPDLLAPGEKIVSCLSQDKIRPGSAGKALYLEDSGTSMAAPHVSGAIAALLSVRREFIGRSAEVKRILLASALDLQRDRHMQGHGLLDLFSALQSI